MPDRDERGRSDESLNEFLELIRASGSMNYESLWNALADTDLPTASLEKALHVSRDALAIGRGQLTLGKYLSELRARKGASRKDVAKEARLSPDVVAELEGDRAQVQSIPAERLAVLAILLDAFKAAMLELLQERLTSVGSGALPRLTRMSSEASYLESERARRHTQAGGTRLPVDKYLSDFSNAYDEEKEKSLRP